MDSPAKSAHVLAEEQVETSSLEVSPDSTEAVRPEPWIKVRSLAQKQLDRFLSYEPRVLRGSDPDAIHDMRVASRRLQQVLDLLHPVPHGEVRKLRRKIQRTRRALGDVRNADVQIERVSRILRRKRAARRAAWEALHDYMTKERDESFSRALERIGRLNLADFYLRMRQVLSPGSMLTLHAGELDEREGFDGGQFEPRVSAALTRVWQDFESQVEESHRDGRLEVIHGVRIAAKRLRYLVEVLHEFGVQGSADTLTWLRGIQELLGDWHDTEVLEQMMVAMIGRPAFLRDHLAISMDVQKLVLRCRAEKGKYREQYFRKTLEGAEFIRVRNWVENLDLKIESRN